MSVRPVWKKKLNYCHTSNEVDVNLPTPMPKPQSPLKESSQENPLATFSKHNSLQPHSLSLGDSCDTNVRQAFIPPQSVNQTKHTQPSFPHLLINPHVASVLHAQTPPSPQGDNQTQPTLPPSLIIIMEQPKQITHVDQLVHSSKYQTVGRCINYAVLPKIPCPRECRIVGQLLVDHALSYALTATADVPMETPEQPFIPPATLKFIQPFLKIVGYQGLVDKKKEVIQYPCFTKLIIADIIKKFDSIPKRLEEEYHSIKDDTSLVSVYAIGKVTVRGMLIPNDLLTAEIQYTQAYEDYEEELEGVRVRKQKHVSITPPPPSDDIERDEIHKATQLSLALHKTAKAAEEQENVAAVEKKLLEKDVEKLIEGEDDDFDDIGFDDSEKKDENKGDNDDDDDHTDHASIRTQLTGSSEIRIEKMPTLIPSPPRSPRKDLSSDKAIA
ncbi:hypothetical protein Tco_0834302 [Tanacetum coccineum]